jgi:hypothetical protein
MSEINFPGSAVDGSTFFHEDSVCLYHAETNSWECRTIVQPTSQPPDQNVYITTPSVYTLGDKRTEWQAKLGSGGISYALPTVRTQAEVNDAIMDLLCYVRSGSTASVTGASEAWVQTNYAPLVHNHNYAEVNHVHSEYVTKADYNAMVTTIMAAIANNASN